jgi:hypothetical protein
MVIPETRPFSDHIKELLEENKDLKNSCKGDMSITSEQASYFTFSLKFSVLNHCDSPLPHLAWHSLLPGFNIVSYTVLVLMTECVFGHNIFIIAIY